MQYFIHTISTVRRLIRAQKALGDIRLVTTDEVLTELLDGLAQHGAHLREVAARASARFLTTGA